VETAKVLERLRTPEGRLDPYPAYAALHAHGPVVALEGFMPVVVGYSAVDQLLRDPKLMVDDAGMLDRAVPGWREQPALITLASSMLSNNPPDHTRVRRLAASAFTPRRTAALRDSVTAQANALIDGMLAAAADGSEADLIESFAYPLPIGVICALLGVPVSDRDFFRPRAEALTAVQEMQPGVMEAANQAADDLNEYFADLVEQRRKEPRDDFVTALVQAHDADGGRLSADELFANLILLLVAGFETVTNLLGNGLVALLRNPEHADKLRADETLAPAYVEELLRLDAPVQVTSRWSASEVTVAGTTLPKHTIILLMLGAANHDPARFPEPDRFDPDRPDNRSMSWGGGAHICLGMALGRLQAQVAFPLLLQRMPGLELAGEPQRRRDRLSTRGFATVPLSLGGAGR
jgi:cytochrome P450